MNWEKTFVGLFCIFIVIGICITILNLQKEMNQKSEDYCNEKFGVSNWDYVDITGTSQANEIVGKLYIGQVWVCEGMK